MNATYYTGDDNRDTLGSDPTACDQCERTPCVCGGCAEGAFGDFYERAMDLYEHGVGPLDIVGQCDSCDRDILGAEPVYAEVLEGDRDGRAVTIGHRLTCVGNSGAGMDSK